MNQVTQLHCPFSTCEWTLDGRGPASPEVITFPDTDSLMTYLSRQVEGAIRAHLETHPLEEWAQEMMRLREELTEQSRDCERLSARLDEALRESGDRARWLGTMTQRRNELERERDEAREQLAAALAAGGKPA
jgi:hypothetical protein